MKYEYDYDKVPLTEDQDYALQINLGDPSSLNDAIKDILNQRGAEGWEAMAPIMLPTIWFRRNV